MILEWLKKNKHQHKRFILTSLQANKYAVHCPRTPDVTSGGQVKSQDIILLLQLIILETRDNYLKKDKLSVFLTKQAKEEHQNQRVFQPQSLPDSERDNDSLALSLEEISKQAEHWEGWKNDSAAIDSSGQHYSDNRYSVRGLAESLGIGKTEISNSLKRSTSVGMIFLERKTKHPRANRKILLNFLIHGLKYVFPAEISPVTRGIPTSFAAPALQPHLRKVGDLIYVWPDPQGKKKANQSFPSFPLCPWPSAKTNVFINT